MHECMHACLTSMHATRLSQQQLIGCAALTLGGVDTMCCGVGGSSRDCSCAISLAWGDPITGLARVMSLPWLMSAAAEGASASEGACEGCNGAGVHQAAPHADICLQHWQAPSSERALGRVQWEHMHLQAIATQQKLPVAMMAAWSVQMPAEASAQQLCTLVPRKLC